MSDIQTEKLYRPIETLKNWDKNPRTITQTDFEDLKKQIKELGEYKPLIITDDGEVLGGNMRLRAYKDLGYKQVWVSIVYPKTEADKIKYALSDNDQKGEYQKNELADLLGNVPDLDLSGYSVNLAPSISIDKLLKQLQDPEEDEPPAVTDNPISKYGEVYQVGKHRLMCGDSTKEEDVNLLMGEQKADMVFTDPPYGVDYEGKTKDKLKIKNDADTNTFADALINYAMVAKLGAAFYVCCPAGNNFKDFLLPFEEECKVSSTIIWVKNSMVLGHGDYHYQHEPILYGWLKNGTHQFYGDRKQTTVWAIDRPTVSKEHPTMKPIALVAKAINNSSKEDDIVLDLFAGSGSTLIACEQTGRICYTMELDPKYVDVVRKRYAKFIGEEERWEAVTPLVTVK